MYTIARKNIGTARTFQTRSGLERALRKAGAEKVTWGTGCVIIGWAVPDPHANAEVVTYPIDKDGNVDQQLAWDMA